MVTHFAEQAAKLKGPMFCACLCTDRLAAASSKIGVSLKTFIALGKMGFWMLDPSDGSYPLA